MAATYEITIGLSVDTLQALHDNGFSLLAFKCSEATASGGQPAVWIETGSLALSIHLAWEASYDAYVAAGSPIVVNGIIRMSSMAPVTWGQILQVHADGTTTVTDDGPSDAMSILNTTSVPTTCGLAHQSSQGAVPLVALPLYAHSMNAIAPQEKVFLVFETYPAQGGQMLDRTLAQGLLVDLTGETSPSVTFDINAGWSYGGQPWGQIVPPNTPLSSLVKQAPLQLVQQAAELGASLQ